KELAPGPPKPLILYSCRSNKLEYTSSPTAVRLRTLGPFAAGGAARGRANWDDQSVCFSLNKGFLGLGLDSAAATVCRAEQTKTKGSFFWFSSDPPGKAPAAEARHATEARQAAETLGITDEQEKAVG